MVVRPCCCYCSVTRSCPTLCGSMDRSTPGFPGPHNLWEFAQVHVHCTDDAVQPSRPLTPSSPSALDLSQYQGLFQWVIYSHQMTNILELQLQHQSFQWIFGVDFYGSAGKESAGNAGDLGSISGLGRTTPSLPPPEKEKATHSTVLAWRIPWLYSPWGHKESDMTERLSHTQSTSIMLSSFTPAVPWMYSTINMKYQDATCS